MKYRYTAKDSSGRTIRGTVEGGSPKVAAEALKRDQLFPINFSEIKPFVDFSAIFEIWGKVKYNDLANFTRQLSTMITAGLPLTDALNLLKAQSPPGLSGVVGSLLTDIQGGLSLSSSMTRHPSVFSKVYVALVKAGEAAGVMENVLNRLADNSEKTREFTSKVKGAMVYPAIILMGMVGVMFLMMWLVIPKITDLYADFNAELPLATRAIMWLSDAFTTYWWLWGSLLFLGMYGLRAFMATETGIRKWDTLKYRIPITGELTRQVMLTELSRTLSLLIGSGISVIDALNIVADALGNVMVEKDVRRIARQVEKGFPISIAFSESEIFPPVMGQMIAVGEETGKIDEVLFKLSKYFELESEQKIKGLTTAIEPLILIVLAIGVGFLMYAVVMPIYSITNQF
ncbi:MAG: pilin biogenesis protein [Candidatus Amesbacteria bacterium GW2011_GWC1_47_15]|uniref:Pilin biogenesis protein n=2 Tax=Candidatus Amesiibacteriota TaxID=1752730 RepID=A0A0G1UEU2_9BACT|nr:MAG: pilin biogenesis protein [Candidatus Amesbacteria bacterium GW2011_GWC1_47_15]KKU96568.1 MAG: pilin biogenesis protein [Candidatus Amesbacteria bacterium GW2011_GWB1_48_13]